MTFLYPAFFFLLLLCIPLVLWYMLSRKSSEPALRVATTRALQGASSNFSAILVHIPFVLRLAVFVLVVIILARPQTKTPLSEREVEGIDIMIAMDISQSMLTEGFSSKESKTSRNVQ